MIKVTKMEDTNRGITAFYFECNSADDHETLDKLRVAMMGEVPRMVEYRDSNTLVLQAKIPEVEL